MDLRAPLDLSSVDEFRVPCAQMKYLFITVRSKALNLYIVFAGAHFDVDESPTNNLCVCAHNQLVTGISIGAVAFSSILGGQIIRVGGSININHVHHYASLRIVYKTGSLFQGLVRVGGSI